MLESAHNADASHADVRVFRHRDLAAAHDRDDVDVDLAVLEPGLAQVDLAAAHEQERGEMLRHYPLAFAGETAKDGHRAARRGRAAKPGRVNRSGDPRGRWGGASSTRQVMGDGLKLRIGLRRIHGVKSLVQFVHGEPPVPCCFAQHVGDALAIGVGGAHVLWFWDSGRATHIW